MKAKTCIAAFVALIAGGVFASDMLPERILSGYYGYNVTRKGDHERNLHMIDVLAANGFNSYETKIQARGRHFDVAPYVPQIKELADRAKSKGMIFQIYLYTVPYLANRDSKLPEHASLPSPVAANGKEISNAFLLTDPAVWRQLFHHAFAFARHQEEIGNATLKFDVERIGEYVSFDDSTWEGFCKDTPGYDRSAPVASRSKILKSKRGNGRIQEVLLFQGGGGRSAVREGDPGDPSRYRIGIHASKAKRRDVGDSQQSVGRSRNSRDRRRLGHV